MPWPPGLVLVYPGLPEAALEPADAMASRLGTGRSRVTMGTGYSISIPPSGIPKYKMLNTIICSVVELEPGLFRVSRKNIGRKL